MEIREMLISDFAEVRDLWLATGAIELKKSDECAEIQRMIERNPTTCIVGTEGERIVAAVMGGFDGRRGMVHHLAVHPTVQGKGYGRQIMDELERRFADLGVIKVNLFVLASNAKVLGFYDKLGYSRRSELITMSKALSEEY